MKELLLVAGIHWLAVMSPGPDFAMVLRNSLIYSRRTGIMAAIGLGLGIALHVSYSLLGIGLIISQSVMLFNTIKLLGAGYLIYIGLKSLLLAKKPDQKYENTETVVNSKTHLDDFSAVKLGFLTNALNPKATLFFLALFTQVISPSTPLVLKAMYGLEMSIATFIWFSIVAILLTQKRINNAFAGVIHQVERVFGVILISLGIKVALGGNK